MIEEYFQLLKESMGKIDKSKARESIQIVQQTLVKGNLVCTIGNGGSSATASHYVNDWVKGFSSRVNQECRAICLSDNTPLITAIANDISFDEIYSYQVNKFMSNGDVLVCVSGSGNSRNILAAVEAARSQNVIVIGVTGFDGGALLKNSDYSFHVPVEDMQIVEDLHSMFGHLVLRTNLSL